MNTQPTPPDPIPKPTEAEIRERAYHRYEQSGHLPGRDLENWLAAEQELVARWRELHPVPAKWAWHHRALMRLRDALVSTRDEHAQAMRAPLPHGGADAADIANDESDHDTLFAELALENAKLAEVDAALERIAHGTYGVCEVTGQPIPTERLRAIPWARRCVAAARQG